MRLALATAFALIVLPATAEGQACPSNMSESQCIRARDSSVRAQIKGSIVRVRTATDSPVVGRLMYMTFDSLYVNQCPLCRRFRWSTSEVTSLEVHHGSSRTAHFGIGLGLGALAGAAVIGGFAVSQPCHANDTDVCSFRVLAFPYGGAIGALVGGAIGMAIPSGERWEPVTISH